MAVSPGVQAGKTPYQVAGAQAVAPVRYGNSAAQVYTATAGVLTLPTDPQGNAYAAYRIVTSVTAWVCWGAGPAVVNTANEWLQGPGIPQDIVPPVGTTQASVICADSLTAGSISIVGLY